MVPSGTYTITGDWTFTGLTRILTNFSIQTSSLLSTSISAETFLTSTGKQGLYLRSGGNVVYMHLNDNTVKIEFVNYEASMVDKSVATKKYVDSVIPAPGINTSGNYTITGNWQFNGDFGVNAPTTALINAGTNLTLSAGNQITLTSDYTNVTANQSMLIGASTGITFASVGTGNMTNVVGLGVYKYSIGGSLILEINSNTIKITSDVPTYNTASVDASLVTKKYVDDKIAELLALINP
jgi:hypothetical protein